MEARMLSLLLSICPNVFLKLPSGQQGLTVLYQIWWWWLLRESGKEWCVNLTIVFQTSVNTSCDFERLLKLISPGTSDEDKTDTRRELGSGPKTSQLNSFPLPRRGGHWENGKDPMGGEINSITPHPQSTIIQLTNDLYGWEGGKNKSIWDGVWWQTSLMPQNHKGEIVNIWKWRLG